MNYATLAQAIMDWLNKDNIHAVLPTLIRFGQIELEDKLRIRPMEYKPTNGTVSAGTDSLVIPDDFLELKYLVLLDGTTRNPIEIKVDVKEMYRISTDTSYTGLPRAICQIGDSLFFDVKTDIEYTREWTYYRRLPALVAAAPDNVNWWVEKAEQAFLMTCLNLASRYISGIPEGDKKKWKDAAEETRHELFMNHHKELTGGATLRTNAWQL